VALSARFTYLVLLVSCIDICSFSVVSNCNMSLHPDFVDERALKRSGEVEYGATKIVLFCFVLFYHSLHVYHCQIG
jgi:hypothetical protein